MSRAAWSLRAAALCAAMVVAAGLAGCSLWGGSSRPKPADLGPVVPLLPVHQVWSAHVGPVAGLSLTPLVHGDTVVLASEEGGVSAIDARTGASLWSARLGTALSAGVGSDGQYSAVVSKARQLIALEGGREIWRQPLPAQTFTAPLVAGARVFVLTADRTVMAFDARTGYRLWSQPRSGDPLVLRQGGLLMAVGNTLVAGLSGRLVGFDPDNGVVRWEAPLASPRGTNDVERLVEILGHASRVGTSICARAFQAAVGCVDAARGALLWTHAAHGAEGIDGDDTALFGTESNGVVQAWRRSDGAALWSYDKLRYRRLTAPLVLGRSVIVGDESGQVHLLTRDDGAPLNRLGTDASGVAAAPVVAGKTLVVVTRQGGVYGFRPD